MATVRDEHAWFVRGENETGYCWMHIAGEQIVVSATGTVDTGVSLGEVR